MNRKLVVSTSALLAVALLIAATGLVSSMAMAQKAQVQRSSAVQLRRAMDDLKWMIGDWTGTGWVESARLGRQEFSYRLSVRPEFEGLVFIVDGAGFDAADLSTEYAEQLLIEGPQPALVPGPPGTYSWKEFTSGGLLHWNEAQGTRRKLQVGFPLLRQDCDRITNDSYRTYCQADGGELLWSRATISLDDKDQWIESREWQDNEKDSRAWHEYFKVVLHRVR